MEGLTFVLFRSGSNALLKDAKLTCESLRAPFQIWVLQLKLQSLCG